MRRSPNVGSMLAQRRRRLANIAPILGERLVFAGPRSVLNGFIKQGTKSVPNKMLF